MNGMPDAPTMPPPAGAAMPPELAPYVAAGVLDAADGAAVRMLVRLAARTGPIEPATLAWVAMGLAMRTPRDGHTCVQFEQIAEWAGEISTTAPAAGEPPWPTDPQPWLDALRAVPVLVGGPGDRAPFILEGDAADARLYLARAFTEEREVAAALLADGAARVSVLLGGPGSGKTYTLTKDLIEMFAAATTPLRIALAAPTGKAAARMTKALEDRCVKAAATPEVLAAVRAAPATTVHRLLRYAPDRTPRFAYGPGNPLDYDLVVVDEVSMLSTSLLHRLLAALGPATAIRLVGDPDQLASVESGSVLHDIATACRRPDSPLHARLTELTGQHRYAADSGVAGLAAAIRRGDAPAALAMLAAGLPDVEWITPENAAAVEATTDLAAAHARRLRDLALRGAGTDADARAVLAAQATLQVLCARRDGPTGVAGWNQRIERRLSPDSALGWYAGRPIMVTRNNPDVALANGDVGMVVPADERRMDAVFPLGEEIVRVPVTRLEDVATVHALTIHKSQGSEYDHAIVVLPERAGRLLTRELLYTGVTRAAKRVTVIGSRGVIQAAIATPIRRATGLARRL
ncbi:MAG: exodeoxyribonuclease V subunit alpha [Planctomycetes bacterium]|nr:exodeoxyribonuclease V subunit alpha [Planctomycetota bacterium]